MITLTDIFAYLLDWIGFILVPGTMILFLTALIWLAACRLSAAIRHLILLCGLSSLVLGFLAQQTIPLANQSRNNAATPIALERADQALEQSSPERSTDGGSQIINSTNNTDEPTGTPLEESRLADNVGSNRSPTGEGANQTPTNSPAEVAGITSLTKKVWSSMSRWLASVAPFVTFVWAAITTSLLIRLILAAYRINRLRQSSTRLSHKDLPVELQKILPRRTSLILAPTDTQMPMAFGVFCPAIALPANFFQIESIEQKAILLHESAHHQRRDPITNLLVQLISSIAWFNPLVWLVARQLRIETEFAADNRVIKAGLAPSDYVESLFSLVKKRQTNLSSTPAVAIGMAKSCQLDSRFKTILNPKTLRNTVTGRSAAMTTCGFSLIVLTSLFMPIKSESSQLNGSIDLNPLESNEPSFVQDDETNKKTPLIRGQILDADGTPNSKCKVLFRWYANLEGMPLDCDSNANFEFNMPEGILGGVLVVANPDYSLMSVVNINTAANPDEDPKPLKVTLEPTLSTELAVRDKGENVGNAIVYARGTNWVPVFYGSADSNGNLLIKTPKSYPLEAIWVLDTSRGVGLWYPEVKSDSVERAIEKHPTRLTIDLLPTRTCTVTVVDEEENPVPDQEIFPFFRVEEDSNRKMFPQIKESYARTNEKGIATFHWMPAEPANWFIPTLISKKWRKYSPHHVERDLRSPDQKLFVRKIPPKYKIRGKVVGPDGAPLKGITILGDGITTQPQYALFNTTTDEQGEFTAEVFASSEYSLVAIHNDWASDVFSRVLVNSEGNQVVTPKLELYPAKKVSVKFTRGSGENIQPVTRGDVIVEQLVSRAIRDPSGELQHGAATLRSYQKLDANGELSVGLGNGVWSLTARSGKWSERKKLSVEDSDPIDITFHNDWLGEKTVSGKVVIDDEWLPNPQRVIETCEVAVIDNRYRSQVFKTKVDSNGTWSADVDVRREFAVLAHSADRKFAGVQFVSAEDELSATIRLKPSASLSGRLVDEDGNPLANKKVLQFHEHGKNDKITYAAVNTDENGRFTMSGVLPDIQQRLVVETGPGNYKFVGRETKYETGESREDVEVVWIDYAARERARDDSPW